jgi:DnaK suppressor protein
MPKTQLPILPPGYEPNESEEYMSALQLEFFKAILLKQLQDVSGEFKETLEHLQIGLGQPDLNDQAAMEAEAAVELRNGDRKRKLINKISLALHRIETGEYGYCEETGEPIGLARLRARPIATLCIDAQERYEKLKKQFVDSSEDDIEESREGY